MMGITIQEPAIEAINHIRLGKDNKKFVILKFVEAGVVGTALTLSWELRLLDWHLKNTTKR